MFKTIVAVLALLALAAGGVYLLSTGGIAPSGVDVDPGTKAGPQAFVAPVISPEEAYKRWNEDPVRTVLLDVRTVDEYVKWNIPGAVHADMADDDFGKQVAEKIPNKDTDIFLICRSGRRTKLAAAILGPLGYRNLRDLGGIIDWPYETSGSDGSE